MDVWGERSWWNVGKENVYSIKKGAFREVPEKKLNLAKHVRKVPHSASACWGGKREQDVTTVDQGITCKRNVPE